MGSTGLRAQATGVLTVAQAVDEALAKNDRLVNQRDTTEQADLGVRLARNDFQPKVVPNILGSFGQTDVSSQTYRVDLTQRFTTGTEVRLGVGTATAQIPGQPGVPGGDIRFYNADTTLTLSQPLLKGFGRNVARRSLTSAELRRADAERQQTMAEQQVAVEVVAAYYRVVASESFVSVARQSLDRSRKLRDASEAKLDAGLVSQLDVLRAQQLVSQAEMQLFDAQSATEDARDQLLFLMGRAAGERFEVLHEIPAPETSPMDVDNAIAIALATRLDLQGRAADSADADRYVSYARNQLLPQVDVNLALTRRQTTDTFARSFGLDGFQFATFFTIAMPVDRTAQLIDFQNAVIDRDRRKRDLATLERQVADDVRRSIRERDRLLRNVIAAETNVAISRREVEVAQLRYERGLSNNLDVVTAESGLLMAESRRIQALADSAVARLRLRAVIGVLNPRIDIDPPGVGRAVVAGPVP
jgi:outer membrane protein TolC